MNDTTKLAKRMWRAALAIILVLSMLGAASVTCFAETTETEEAVTWEFKDMNVSIGENVVVKFYTSATTGDGSKLEVKFNGYTHEITENEGGVFEFYGVTPQMFNETMVATLYNPDGNKADETEAVSVKSYLEGLLALPYENSGCKSTLQYDAMRELCVNMLNYGAAAQEYVDHDVENLANAGLTDDQKALATEKIEVTDTDKAVSGTAWVGAGVRFDYTLGLYFVFKAASADEYTATLNGEAADVEAYEALGDGYYVIRYNSFNVTNMNEVVTAKLTKDGAEDQTFTYSIKSYVASKGNSDSKIANLVNATYTYGYAAVAYSAEYVTTDPTFDEAGSISMDAKGYDFSNTKYGTVTLPKLDFTNYTAETVNSGTELAPEVTTTFTLNDDTVAYAKVFNTDNCISLEGKLYSQYDLANFKFDNVTVSYDPDEKIYTYDVENEKTATPTAPFTAYGADLTITGVIEMNGLGNWEFHNIDVTMGTKDKNADITVSNGTGSTSIRIANNANVLVSSNSKLTVTGGPSYSIYIGVAADVVGGASLIVDGEVTAEKAVRVSDMVKNNTDFEYGFDPAVYVRSGTLKTKSLQTWSLQVGSEADDVAGTLEITSEVKNAGLESQKNGNYDNKWVFAKGTFKTTYADGSGAYLLPYNSTYAGYADIRKGMTFEVANGYVLAMGQTNSQNYVLYLQPGATVTHGAGDSNTFINVTRTTLHLYLWDEIKTYVDGVEHTVRVVEYQALKQSTKEVVTNITVAQYNEMTEILPAGTEITSSSREQEMGKLGTFVQGTYGDGKTVWYQIVN